MSNVLKDPITTELDLSIIKMYDKNQNPQIGSKPRKRPIIGDKKTLEKQKRLSNHQTGPNCHCSRFHCYENVSAEERDGIIAHFNSLGSKDEQDCLLSSYITITPVQRRKANKDREQAHPHDFSYRYSVSVSRSGTPVNVPVCHKAFLSLFGVTRKRIELIRDSVVKTGKKCTVNYKSMIYLHNVSICVVNRETVVRNMDNDLTAC